MKKFLLIYHSPKEALEKFSTMSKDDIQKDMDIWEKWGEKNKGYIIDFGNPVGTQHVVSADTFKEKGDDVTGYSIIQAEDINQAKELLKDHPALKDNDGSTLSLYPVVDMD